MALPTSPTHLPAPEAIAAIASSEDCDHAWTAQERLHRRYWTLSNKSNPTAKIVTALARELAGFVWAIGVESERDLKAAKDRVAA
jgi:hypothetical protein